MLCIYLLASFLFLSVGEIFLGAASAQINKHMKRSIELDECAPSIGRNECATVCKLGAI